MNLKTVIIDDEQSARNILNGYIEKYCDDVEVVGFGENVKSGSGLTTVNHTVDYCQIACKSKLDLVETGLTKLGAFIGDSVSIGARHTLGPGSIVESKKIIADFITL